MPRPGRPSSESPAAVLRAALRGPFPEIREAAELVIRRAMRHKRVADRIQELGLADSTYYDLRDDFREVFAEPAPTYKTQRNVRKKP